MPIISNGGRQQFDPTLPGVEPADCVPALCAGYRRVFDVAFPNDGSHADKAYFDAEGMRPPYVLMANMIPSDQSVNGICVPVSDEGLQRLRGRELRYSLVDVSGRVDHAAKNATVMAFVGRKEYVKSEHVHRGVVSSEYLRTILTGVDFWEGRAPGFRQQYENSTQAPSAVVDLLRVDQVRP
jgi:hypothetical protein